jgi:hypothetical protein
MIFKPGKLTNVFKLVMCFLMMTLNALLMSPTSNHIMNKSSEKKS